MYSCHTGYIFENIHMCTVLRLSNGPNNGFYVVLYNKCHLSKRKTSKHHSLPHYTKYTMLHTLRPTANRPPYSNSGVRSETITSALFNRRIHPINRHDRQYHIVRVARRQALILDHLDCFIVSNVNTGASMPPKPAPGRTARTLHE